MCGIDWTGARILAAGIAQGLRWPLVAQLLARFETGAIKGAEKRRKSDKEED